MLRGQLHQIPLAWATALLCLVVFLYSEVRWRAIRRLLTLIQSKPNHFSSSALPRQSSLLWRAKVGISSFFTWSKQSNYILLELYILASHNISLHLTTPAINYPSKWSLAVLSVFKFFLDQQLHLLSVQNMSAFICPLPRMELFLLNQNFCLNI